MLAETEEKRGRFQPYRADPDLSYLLKSLLGEDGREMGSHSLVSPRDKTLPNNEKGNTGGELKTWYNNLPIKKISDCACSRLCSPGNDRMAKKAVCRW